MPDVYSLFWWQNDDEFNTNAFYLSIFCFSSLDSLKVNLSYVLPSEPEASFNEVAQPPSARAAKTFFLNVFESYYKFTQEKKIDIC